MKTRKHSNQSGISLVEMIIIMSVLGVIVGIVSIAPLNINQRVKHAKLESDVATINSAIASYLAFNGNLDDTANAEEVLEKLKTRGDANSAATTLGLRGQFLDPRTRVVRQSDDEADSDKTRAYWDADARKFRVAESGPAGVKEFILDAELSSVTPTEETRDPMMKLATTDTWIWDYEEREVGGSAGPTVIPVGTVPPTTTDPDPTTPTGTPPVEGTTPLQPPLFSIPSGDFPITDYGLTLALTNPNPGGSSTISYSVDYGNWIDYAGGAIDVAPGAVVRAQALPVDRTVWSSSIPGQEIYGALPISLEPPVILPSAQVFSELSAPTILVSLENPNNPLNSSIYYRLEGGPWRPYSTPFSLAHTEHLDGTNIDARAVPTREYFLTSPLASTTLSVGEEPDDFSISGSATGAFSNVRGSSGLITNLTGNFEGPFVEWGQAVIPTGTNPNNQVPGTNGSWASTMGYGEKSFSDVQSGERFEIGNISYFNGTIRGGTGATSIDLTIEIDITGGDTITFEHTIQMINSPNVDNNEVASADSVKFVSLKGESPATIDGREFNLHVEFGRTDDNGFATINEFFVFENATANGTLFGRLVEVGGDN